MKLVLSFRIPGSFRSVTRARLRRWALWLMIAGVGLAPPAVSLASTADLLAPEEGRLKNGLRVLTLPAPSSPVLSFQVWYDVGSRNERPGITGISHFFEHIMFTGSKKFGPGEHARRIEQVGGVSNAYTTWDVTVYSQLVPGNQLELCAKLEADRMRSLDLTLEKVEAQRKLSLQERRAQIDAQPLGYALEALIAASFDTHPYRWLTLGMTADVETISLEDVEDYYAIHYAPDKATIVVCGPVTHAQVMKVVKKHFGRLKKGREAPPITDEGEAQTEERRVQLESRIQVPLLIAGYRSPPESNPDSQILELANRILVQGSSSRLHHRLVTQEGLSIFTGGASRGRKDPGLFYVFAAGRPGVEREALETAVFDEIGELAGAGPTEAELARIKQQAESEHLLRVENAEGRAQVVGQAALIAGDDGAANGRIEIIRKTTAEDIQRVVREYLIPSHRTVVWLVPFEGSGS
jgi:zinc protease